jgi:hypothetical protein
MDDSVKAIRECACMDCSLYPYRMNKRPAHKPEHTPGQAIREYCIHCQGWRGKEGRNTAIRLARECHIEKCAIWHLRPGQKMKRQAITPRAQAIYSAEDSETLNDTADESERQEAPLFDGA